MNNVEVKKNLLKNKGNLQIIVRGEVESGKTTLLNLIKRLLEDSVQFNNLFGGWSILLGEEVISREEIDKYKKELK